MAPTRPGARPAPPTGGWDPLRPGSASTGGWVLTLFVLLTGYGLYRILLPMLRPLLWAAVLATVCYPIYSVLARRSRRSRPVGAAMAACAIVTVMLLVPMTLLVLAVAKESVDASAHLQEFLATQDLNMLLRQRAGPLLAWLERTSGGMIDVGRMNISGGVMDVVRQLSGWLVSYSSSILSGFTAVIVDFFLMLVSMYFLFLDGPSLVRQIKAVIPLPAAYQDAILARFREVTVATLYGMLATAVSQGLVGALGFTVLRLPSPLFWGALMGIASFIPLIGAGLVWIPAVIYLFLVGAWGKAVAMLVIGLGPVNLVDNVVRPLVMHQRMRMHILLLFMTVLGGLQVFGLIGVVLGPLLAAAFQVCLSLYQTEMAPTGRRPSG